MNLDPSTLWTAWEFEPGVVIPLAVSGLLFALGARKSRGVHAWQMTCFWTGWTLLALALVSPLHPLGAELFSAHMVQHEVLMLLSPPLLVISRPLVPMLWGLPLTWRRAIGHAAKSPLIARQWHSLTEPISAWSIHAVALWFWHAPKLFQATLVSDWAHTAQHLKLSAIRSSLLVVAVLCAWPVGLRKLCLVRLHDGTAYVHSGRAADLRTPAVVSGIRRQDGHLGIDALGRPANRRPRDVGSSRDGVHGLGPLFLRAMASPERNHGGGAVVCAIAGSGAGFLTSAKIGNRRGRLQWNMADCQSAAGWQPSPPPGSAGLL